jgi:hypothetical protein
VVLVAAKKETASAPAKETAPIVEPSTNEAPSSDSTHYVCRPTSHEFPADQGLQTEQVFDAVK